MKRWLIQLTFLLISGLILVCSCQQAPQPPDDPVLTPETITAPKPANFILCIDNSRSIRRHEQIVIRETAMLLADLAEVGDNIAVVTFGRQANIVLNQTMRSDRDRLDFKRLVQEKIRFDENYSDIRAGLKVIADNRESLIKPEIFIPYIIVFSDGKLEPADKKTNSAFKDMLEICKNDLAGIDIFSVVLGDTYSNDVIIENIDGRPLNGLRLMRDYLASPGKNFFHAHQIDELLNITVDILSQTKGSSAIGEKAAETQFRIDDTVKTMTLIVRKRRLGEDWEIKSADIILSPPETATSSRDQAIYKNQEYLNFDLYVIRNPEAGIWSVKTSDNRPLEVISQIDTPINLRVDVRPSYYASESDLIRAWIFDDNAQETVNNSQYRINAHLGKQGQLQESNIYLDFLRDTATGQYYCEAPAALLKELGITQESAQLSVQVIARRLLNDGVTYDPWFIRRSRTLSLDIVAPFYQWLSPDKKHLKYPFVKQQLVLGASLKVDHEQYPAFELLPRLKIFFDGYNTESSTYHEYSRKTMDARPENSQILFKDEHVLSGLKAGQYRYWYEIEGTLEKGGLLSVKSPVYYFTVENLLAKFWWVITLGIVIIVGIIGSLTAKMTGTISTDGQTAVINSRHYQSEGSFQNRFNLSARRIAFFKPSIKLTVTQGRVVVNTTQLVSQGQTIKLNPGKHIIFQEEGDSQVERQLLLNV